MDHPKDEKAIRAEEWQLYSSYNTMTMDEHGIT
jgi:hypothetical protein